MTFLPFTVILAKESYTVVYSNGYIMNGVMSQLSPIHTNNHSNDLPLNILCTKSHSTPNELLNHVMGHLIISFRP